MRRVSGFVCLLALSSFFCFMGCGGGGSSSGSSTSLVSVTGVTLNKNSATILVGGTVQITETIAPANATDTTVNWSSDNTSVATVDPTGLVTGISAGSANITVTTEDGGKTSLCAITVTNTTVSVAGVSLNTSSASTIVGGTIQLTETISPTTATNQNVIWSSSNTSIATVSSSGVVTGNLAGTATITVTTVDGSKTATCMVTVATASVSVTGVTLNTISTSINVGGTASLVATIAPTNATNQNVTWSETDISGSNVASVSTSGVVTGKSIGTANITATTVDGSKTATCTVTVSAAPVAVSSLTINQSSAGINVGGTLQLLVTVNPTNATNQNVNWTSTDVTGSGVASVSTSGVVIGNTAGTSIITVTASDKTYGTITQQCTITVDIPSTVSTFAGTTMGGYMDGTGTAARFYNPDGITTDGTNLYVVNNGYNAIRKIVISSGVVTTIAGSSTGTGGFKDGTGSDALFWGPEGITIDPTGTNLYVTDTGNYRIRKIAIATGVVTTLAGSSTAGSSDGTGTAASFRCPKGIVIDPTGTNLYVVDRNNHEIRKIVIGTGALNSGIVSTFAGSTTPGSYNAVGTNASFNYPWGITTDGSNLYVADSYNYKIRKIIIATGAVSNLIVNDHLTGLTMFQDIACDGTNLYVTDAYNWEIWKIVIATGAVYTAAGSIGVTGHADGIGVSASFNAPYGISVVGSCLYVSDSANNMIRRIMLP